MRTVNVRRLIGLILVAVVMAGGTHLLHGYQVRRNVGMFLREARRAQANRRPNDAVANYFWYLRLVPGDTEVATELGMLLADLGRNTPAFMTLEDVLRRAPQQAGVRRRLVKVALALNRPSDARSHLERYLLKASPEDAELWDLLGQCQEAQGTFAEALASWDHSLRLDPERLELHARRARLLRKHLERPQEADAAMDQLVQEHGQAAEAYLLRSRYAAEAKRPEAALRDAEKALELKPDDLEALRLASVAALEQRQFDQAAHYAQRGWQAQPKQMQVYLTLSAVSLGKGERDEAIQWLRRGLEAVPGNKELQWNLANTLLESGDLEQTESLMEPLNDSELPEALVGYLRARLLHARQQWRDAARLLEQLRPALREWPELVKQSDGILGDCYGHLGNADLQLAAYRRALEVDPFWGPARSGVAEALVTLGRQDEALPEFRRLVESPEAPPQSWVPYARLLIASTLRQPPAQRSWEQVEEVLRRVAEALPNSSDLELLRAEALVAQDHCAEAETQLRRAVEHQPQRAELWEARIALAERQADWNRVESLLEEAQAAVGETLGLRLARARSVVTRLGKEAAAALRKLAEEKGSLPEVEQRQLVRQLAPLALEAGDYEQVEQLCRWLAEREPNDVSIELLRFERARLAEDRPGMEAALRQIERIEGGGPLWLYHRAICLSFHEEGAKPLQQAQQVLTQARVLRPAWSDVPALAADLYLRQGKEEQAVQNYLEAIELGNRSPVVIRRAVQLLYQQGRYPEASRVLQRLEEQANFLSPELNRVASQISFHLDQLDRAVAWARRTAEGSRDYRDHLWLGLVLGTIAQRASRDNRIESHSLAEAERALRQALDLDDRRPECWGALLQLLAQSGQFPRAEEVLKEAQTRLPAPLAALVTAQGYESLGRSAEAAQRYEAAAALDDDSAVMRRVVDFHLRRGDYAAAEPHLKRVVEGAVRASGSEVGWARRNWAMALLARGDYGSLQQAAEMIRRNLAVDASSPDDLRTYGLILGSFPQPERRREAVQVLEQLLATQTIPAAEDRFVLAQLYLAQGDWTNANRQMRALLASHGEEARYVASYVRALLEHQESGEVELWLTRLEQVAPSDYATAELRTEYNFGRGRYEEIGAIWDNFLRSPVAAEDAMKPARVAATLESLGLRLVQQGKAEPAARFLARAEELYREYVGEHPEHALVLTSFWARQRRFDEAVANLETHGLEADADLLAAAFGTLLASAGAESAAISQAERVLGAALEPVGPSTSSRRPVALLLTAADLRTAQRRYAEAETLLRQVLAQEATHVLAMNNLALLLAIQKRDLSEARRLMDQVLELGGPKAAHLDARAAVCLAAGDAKQAARDLDDALAQAPNAVRLFRRAVVHQRLGQTQEAAAALQQAGQMGLTAEQLPPAEREELTRLKEIVR